MKSRSIIELSQSALVGNYRVISKKVPHLKLLPMIKADAYGHDACFVAKSLLSEKSLHGFGVATFREAIQIRDAIRRPAIPILVFSDSAPWNEDLSRWCLKYGLEPVFSELTSLLEFQASRYSKLVSAHVEVNTGMNRMGIPVDSLSCLRFYPKSVFTHLADAESPKSKISLRQIQMYSEVAEEMRSRFPRTALHFANSSAIWNARHFPLMKKMDWARPGLSLYGVRPFDSAAESGLKRVMRLTSRVLNRIHLERGDAVGYGGTYVCKKPGGEWIAILGGGYADGVFRSLSNQGVAYHGGRKLRFRGRVSMDLSAIEGNSKIKIGDEIELWGDRVDPYEQAGLAGTIPYEITTRIGARVERNYEP